MSYKNEVLTSVIEIQKLKVKIQKGSNNKKEAIKQCKISGDISNNSNNDTGWCHQHGLEESFVWLQLLS
jgi:hypothetical protein